MVIHKCPGCGVDITSWDSAVLELVKCPACSYESVVPEPEIDHNEQLVSVIRRRKLLLRYLFVSITILLLIIIFLPDSVYRDQTANREKQRQIEKIKKALRHYHGDLHDYPESLALLEKTVNSNAGQLGPWIRDAKKDSSGKFPCQYRRVNQFKFELDGVIYDSGQFALGDI